MRVLLLGARGFIGSHIAACLLANGHEVRGFARSAPQVQSAGLTWRTGDLAQLTTPDSWIDLVRGMDAVVNAAGALQDGPRDSLHIIHVAMPQALFAACSLSGVRRIIHISAAGIDEVDTAFSRTKRNTEHLLRESSLDWIVLRPALVIARDAYGGTALLRSLAAIPCVTPVVSPNSIVQTVAIDDLARTVVFCLAQTSHSAVVWELANPAKTALKDLLSDYRRWLNLPDRPFLRVPARLAKLAGLIADMAGLLGWRSPARTTALKQLAKGVEANSGPWLEATGAKPVSLPEYLATHPATAADLWFSRLYLLKPLCLVLMSVFWVGSGLVALGPGHSAAVVFLRTDGASRSLAPWILFAGAWLDIILGALLLVRRFSNAILVAMILVCLGYLAAGTVLRPDLWLDPLGAFAKIVPIMLALVFLSAIGPERS